jgi:L-iditol 2-dehydrogenase
MYLDNKKLEIAEAPKPHIQRNSMLVKISAAAICGTDLRTYRHGSERIVTPRILGHEACGIIEEAGNEIKNFTAGDKVITAPAVGCGYCRWCKKGATNMCENLKTIGFDYDGAFAEYMAIPPQALLMGNVLHVKDSISTEQAVIVEPVACCLNGQEFLHISHEDTVFIFGAGFIGCVHAELSAMKNAKKVIISDISDTRLEIAKSILPDIISVNTSKTDITDFLQDITSGMGADVIITACPSGEAHTTALQIAAKRARISLFGGIPGDGYGFLSSNIIHYKELSLYGSHASTVRQNKQVLDWLETGKMDLGKYISGEFPLEKIEEAFESLKSEKMIKVIIKP